MILRCRTRKEAYLVCEELAEVDVVAIMPGNEQLWSQLRQNGYVEGGFRRKPTSQLAT